MRRREEATAWRDLTPREEGGELGETIFRGKGKTWLAGEITGGALLKELGWSLEVHFVGD